MAECISRMTAKIEGKGKGFVFRLLTPKKEGKARNLLLMGRREEEKTEGGSNPFERPSTLRRKEEKDFVPLKKLIM